MIEPPEIKEALGRIIADVRDSIKFYNNDPKYAASIKKARALDSLANLHQQGERLAELFRSFNGAYEKLPATLRSSLKGDARKNWMRFQVSNAISGGKWHPSRLFDGVDVPVIFPTKEKAGSSFIRLRQEVSNKIEIQKREIASKPLQLMLSFPADGAFNFHKKELNGEFWGYMIFNRPIEENRGRILAAKWTNNKGQSIYTYASTDYLGRVDYIVPVNLIPGLVYKLDIVWMANVNGLQSYWDACCYGGSNFFNIDLSSIVAEWVGVSPPVYSIYFRVSKYDNDLVKLKDRQGKFDPVTKIYSLELDEPFDSLELYGNDLIPPRLIVDDMLSSPDYDRIFAPIVANYFVAPRTGKPVDTVNVKTPHPFEEAGLYNQPFVYKMEESRTQLASINKDAETRLVNGYVIPAVGPLKPILKIKGKPAQRITARHFNNAVPVSLSPIVLTFESPKFSAYDKYCQTVHDLLQRRVRDRAAFFYAMEVRHCKQTGKVCDKSPADFEKMEMENLPPTIKTILNSGPAKLKQFGSTGPVYSISSFLPGCTQMSMSMTIDFGL